MNPEHTEALKIAREILEEAGDRSLGAHLWPENLDIVKLSRALIALSEKETLPLMDGRKTLFVTMTKDDGDVKADAAVEAAKISMVVSRIENISPLFFHQLRLRVALEPKLADKILVYYSVPSEKAFYTIGLGKDDERHWPEGFEQGLWGKETEIIAVRAGFVGTDYAAQIVTDLRKKYGC